MKSLKLLGWNSFFEENSELLKQNGFSFARIITEHKERYIVASEKGELSAEITGKLLFSSEDNADLPKVGDWVAVIIYEDEKKAIIHEVLTRRTVFRRKVAGKKIQEQVIASNIDLLLIVQSLDANYNHRRLERYLVMSYEGKMQPVIVFNKRDICPDVNKKLEEVERIFPDINSFAVSAETGEGINNLKEMITEGKTCALVGSSGVGKSSIINRLLGYERQKVNEIRLSDSKGKHTTSTRELILIPGGGIIIDTPGMREFQLWAADSGIENVFNEIDELSMNCHFKDCTHTHEINCSVLDALEKGKLSQERYKSYLKLKKETEWIKIKSDPEEMQKREEKWKKIHKQVKYMKKFNRRNFRKE
ncbi:MAG: ribosome small subunit-dependent GTPase A [Ignavibacteriaceae bacterium]